MFIWLFVSEISCLADLPHQNIDQELCLCGRNHSWVKQLLARRLWLQTRRWAQMDPLVVYDATASFIELSKSNKSNKQAMCHEHTCNRSLTNLFYWYTSLTRPNFIELLLWTLDLWKRRSKGRLKYVPIFFHGDPN